MTYEGPFEDEFEYEDDDEDDDENAGEEWKNKEYDKSDANKWKDGSENEKSDKGEELPTINRRDKLSPTGRVVESSNRPKMSDIEIERLQNRFDEINNEIDEAELILKGLRSKRDSINAELRDLIGGTKADSNKARLNEVNQTIYKLEDDVEKLRIERAETHNLLVDNE